MFDQIKEFFRVLGELKYLIPVLRYKFPDPEDNASLAHSFQDTSARFPDRPFLYFENEDWTYDQTNKAANALARYLKKTGVNHGDRIVLFMENRPSFVVSLLALNKIGAIAVLINTSLTGDPLIHCINSSDSKKCIVGAELALSLEEVLSEINIKNNIMEITLNRPEKKNALNSVMMNEINYALAYAKQEDTIRVVVFAAKGDIFCAGADLSNSKSESNVPKLENADDISLSLRHLFKPVISKIQGSVLAGALLIVCNSTHAIAVREATFSAPEIHRGLWPFMVMAGLFRAVSYTHLTLPTNREV